MKSTIHRDIFKDVMNEFNKLDKRNPNASTEVKLQFAKDYVRAVALAETIEIFRMVYGANR